MLSEKLKSQFAPGWHGILAPELNKAYMADLFTFLSEEYRTKEVCPKAQDIFTAYRLTDYKDIKVVVLGQDPYPNLGDAHGLAFSSLAEQIPASLKNIYLEINDDVFGGQRHKKMFYHSDLSEWAQQGVFLLNTVLTCEAGKSNSHAKRGWEYFTLATIQALNVRKEPIVFLLWGEYAKKYAGYIDKDRHCILTAAHPSPLSAKSGFFGCRHFSQANGFLITHGQKPIDWSIGIPKEEDRIEEVERLIPWLQHVAERHYVDSIIERLLGHGLKYPSETKDLVSVSFKDDVKLGLLAEMFRRYNVDIISECLQEVIKRTQAQRLTDENENRGNTAA